MKKVAITGAAGFIGSNLVLRLLKEGHEVTGIDNLSHGLLSNLEQAMLMSNFKFIQEDIMNTSELELIFKNVNVVYHLAAGKIPRYSDALDTLRTNGLGSESVFRAAFPNVEKVIAASTSDVYGKNIKLPFTEESDLVVGNPDVRRWSYAISKMFEEQLLYAYSERYKIPAVAIRFFGAYGINQSRDWLGGPIPVFIEKAFMDEDIEIHGDGLQTRSFTFIDDHVDALYKLMSTSWESAIHLNLGSDHETTILDLATMVWEQVRPGTDAKVKLIPYSTFGKYEDVMRRVPDCSKARALLNLQKNTPFQEGLEKTVAWQLSRRNQS
jgi:UDP-glucose 4-epimerase